MKEATPPILAPSMNALPASYELEDKSAVLMLLSAAASSAWAVPGNTNSVAIAKGTIKPRL